VCDPRTKQQHNRATGKQDNNRHPKGEYKGVGGERVPCITAFGPGAN